MANTQVYIKILQKVLTNRHQQTENSSALILIGGKNKRMSITTRHTNKILQIDGIKCCSPVCN